MIKCAKTVNLTITAVLKLVCWACFITNKLCNEGLKKIYMCESNWTCQLCEGNRLLLPHLTATLNNSAMKIPQNQLVL